MNLWTPKLRTVLLIVNVTVMVLPLGGIFFLRFYEHEMIRQKESALYAQGAFVSSIYKTGLLARLGGPREAYGLPVAERWRNPVSPDFSYTPLIPSLDISLSEIREPHSRRRLSAADVDHEAAAVGAAINPIIFQAQTLILDGVRIVDAGGVVVASSFAEEGRHLLHWEEVQRSLQGEYVSLLRRRTPGPRTLSPLDALGIGAPIQVFVSMPVVHQARVLGAIVLTGTPSQMTEFVYGNSGQLLTALAMLLVVVTLISVFSSLTISEPMQAIIQQTERVARGDPAGKEPIRYPILHEVKMLTHAITRMASTIEERSAYITSFARSVSHEFKTPLTSITGTTEILLDHGDSMAPEERKRFLSNLNHDAVRLSNLVRRLLDFARAEVTGPGAEPVAVDAVLGSAISRARGEGLNLAVTGVPCGAKVRMAPDLLEAIVANPLDNVRLHTPPGTKACLDVRTTAGILEVVITDDGPGISEANQAKVFQPFFTTARQKGGTGLGLSIVQAIVKAHKGSVVLTSSPQGTRLELRLPLTP